MPELRGYGGSMIRLPETLRIERRGKVIIVTINRPAKRNALDSATVAGIRQVVTEGEAAAVVLASEGDHFSAGLDLNELQERSAAEGMFHSRGWHVDFAAMERSGVPIFAALKGAVIGGGLELASVAHVRIAEPSTFFALPEGERGLFLGGGGSVRLPRLIGVHRVIDMLLTGRVYSAEEGAGVGFAQYLVGEGEALTRAIELAEKAAANAPMTNFAITQAMPRIAEAGTDEGLLLESLMSAVVQSEDLAKSRIRDFLEKRAAKVAAPVEGD
jgi:(methylthio)acryloyl-CoA hydratase